jgi:hypothetical protein
LAALLAAGLVCAAGRLTAQTIYRGIVMDSATLSDLPGVHIAVKNTGRGTITDRSGSFFIAARPADTLVFSAVGYHALELPLRFEEDALFVLLREHKIILSEITVRAKRLYPNPIIDHTQVAPRTAQPLEGMGVRFDYFSQLEREKRKLTRVVFHNNATQTFRQVITDPDVKKIMMEDHDVDEVVYYRLIELFNLQHPHAHYATDPDEIMEALHAFFSKNKPAR